MKNIKKPEIGAGIKALSIIQFVFNGLALIGLILNLFMNDGTFETSDTIITLVLTIILTIGVILILMRKELGIYIYFSSQVAIVVYYIVNKGFDPSILVNLIMPILMGVFIWKRKEIFSVES